MGQDIIAFISYASGSVLFGFLSIVLIYLWGRGRRVNGALIPPAIASMVWLASLAIRYFSTEGPLPQAVTNTLELARNSLWIVALMALLKSGSSLQVNRNAYRTLYAIWLSIAAMTLAATWIKTKLLEFDYYIWSGLSLSIIGIVTVEQLYRNTVHSRLIKLLSIAIAAMFAYDIYMYAHSLIFGVIESGLWQTRGAVNGITALMMILSVLATANHHSQPAKISVSRPVIFYTTSLTVAGSFLTIMAIGGYYIKLYGGSWGNFLRVLILFGTMIFVITLLTSKTIRSILSVWINKNFFHHKYDYRVEWLRLINSLSRPTNNGDFHVRAIVSVASIFKSPGGALWLKEGGYFVPDKVYRMELPKTDLREGIETPFTRALAENEWVFSPNSPDKEQTGALNKHLPIWAKSIPDLWLILPLLTENELIGFMILTEPGLDTSLTWEDLDLVKTVGRQVASYLYRHEAAEMLAESRQFDAFNKLTAFIMHDLKNLIAQQALVVQNAAKHKENPAFVEDAIHTIENSVNRMNTLLKKLQQNEPSELRSISLRTALVEAIRKCKDYRPSPSMRFESDDININADPDRLIMTMAHIIQNAQDATPESGFVDVIIRERDGAAIIKIEDNGKGMEDEFIRTHLFRPFETTKSGKGMGIGAYQAREFVSSLGGKMTVASVVGEGTTFTIEIPLSEKLVTR